eukprot:2105293-Prymnesium_polylepis.1
MWETPRQAPHSATRTQRHTKGTCTLTECCSSSRAQLRIQSAMMEARLDEVQGSDSRRGTQETYDLLQEFNAFNRRVSQGSVAVERRQSIGLGAGVDGPDGRGLQRLNHGQAGRDLQRENSREGARTHRRNSGVPFFLTESHSERVERMDEDDTNESSTKR